MGNRGKNENEGLGYIIVHVYNTIGVPGLNIFKTIGASLKMNRIAQAFSEGEATCSTIRSGTKFQLL